MPKVPALNPISLPRVPQTQPDFGQSSAQRTAAFGSIIQQAGRDMFKIGLDAQLERNAAQFTQRDNALQEQLALKGSEIRNLKGWGADGATESATAWYDDTAGKLLDSLENDAQRQAFADRAAKSKIGFLTQVNAHEQAERRQATNEELSASVANSIRQMAESAGDAETAAAKLGEIDRAAMAMAQINGWAKEVREAKVAGWRTTAHTNVINNLLARDPEAAQTYYHANKEQIDGSQHGEIETRLLHADRLGAAQRLADDLIASGKSEQEQLAALKDEPVAEVRRLAEGIVRQRHADLVAAKRESEAAAWDTVAKRIAAGQSQAEVPPSEWARLKGDDQLRALALWNTRAQQRVEFSHDVSIREYYRLLKQANDDPAAFKREPLDAYAEVIEGPRLHELMQLQTKPLEYQGLVSRTSQLEQAVAASGYNLRDLEKDTKAGEEVRSLFHRFEQELKQATEQAGRPLDYGARQKVLDRLTIKVVRRGMFTGSERPAALEEVPGVPKELVDELAQDVQSAGAPVTPENILKLYQRIYGGASGR